MPRSPRSAPESRVNYTTWSDTGSVSSSCNSSRRSGCSTRGNWVLRGSVCWRRSAVRGRPLPRCAGYSDCSTKTTPLLAPQPGLAELERLVEDTQTAGVAVEFQVSGERVELPAGLELAAYRVAQEALTNVIKHAQPAAAHVRLSYSPNELVVEIGDDGHVPTSLEGGRGIAGMRERVALYAVS